MDGWSYGQLIALGKKYVQITGAGAGLPYRPAREPVPAGKELASQAMAPGGGASGSCLGPHSFDTHE